MKLPRTCSINERAVFERVKKSGQSKAGRFLILSTLPDLELPNIRTGFITTKRSTKKAHDRVLLRRRFRSLVQNYAPEFPEIRRYLVTIARQGAATATFAELEADWVKQARRLGLLPRPERQS
jgi:ribonuclease P protein component